MQLMELKALGRSSVRCSEAGPEVLVSVII